MTDKEILERFNKARKKQKNSVIIRPEFTMYKELIMLIVGACIILISLSLYAVVPKYLFIVILSVELVAYCISMAKNILLIGIFLYQKYAPKSIRGACLFTPSCSQYMILSINKYGVAKGVKKGLNRIRRCHPPNGGIDEP